MNSTELRKSEVSKRSSFFTRNGKSFLRSGGDRGASVAVLRGTKGADFEAPGQVRCGGEGVTCGCWGGGTFNDSKSRYIVIKDAFCFVFENESALAPTYAIRLHNVGVETDATKNPTTVILRDTANKRFIVTLESAEKAQECAVVVRRMALAAETAEIRKRLGHTHLLANRSSVKFAETVALQKTKNQPDAPISTGEMLNNMEMMNHAL